MKRNRFFSNNYTKYFLVLIAGLFLGWLLFHNSGGKQQEDATEVHEDHGDEVSVWTCSMHPQIRMDEPGDCPICGMDLIPLSQSGNVSVDEDAIHLSDEAMALANVQTSIVSKGDNGKEIRLYGRVQADERLLQSQVAHISGRIEKLYVNFTGETVRAGQTLAEIYSPDLLTAQQELLQTAATRSIQPELYEASKERLKQWKLSDNQIKEIETTGKPVSNFRVQSNTSGTITARFVNAGDYVSQGTALFTVADLSSVWLLFDVYESDLGFLEKGSPVTFTLQSFPGKEYEGKISFIDPVIDPVTRVARVRVEYPNKNGELKPEMFATGIVESDLSGNDDMLSIPSSAVLWTGKRSIVYVRQPADDGGIFKMREIELGQALGNSYVVLDGLEEGEEIVTNGAFSVDASAQLEGKPSMMNQAGGVIPTGHDHDAMQGQAIDKTGQQGVSGTQSQKMEVSREFKMQLTGVYDRYIELKNALVASDPVKAAEASTGLIKSVSAVDMKLVTGNAHDTWMEYNNAISKHAGAISSSKSIEDQRASFEELSDQLYKAIKTFGLTGRTVHYQYCPMAFGDKGAYWLSEIEEIRNPWFGEAMLTCGETRERLEF